MVPESRVVLINPLPPLSAGVSATKTSKWLYDPRLKR
jgi:hypothetical protein